LLSLLKEGVTLIVQRKHAEIVIKNSTRKKISIGVAVFICQILEAKCGGVVEKEVKIHQVANLVSMRQKMSNKKKMRKTNKPWNPLF
jgi:hypothetical protein